MRSVSAGIVLMTLLATWCLVEKRYLLPFLLLGVVTVWVAWKGRTYRSAP